MAQVTVNALARPAPPPVFETRRGTVPSEEPDQRLTIRAVGPGSIALDARDEHSASDGLVNTSGKTETDSIRTTLAFMPLDPIDASAWESSWMPISESSDPTGSGGLRFEVELRVWGRLEIGCSPLHPRGWHVSIASDNAVVRRRLRVESVRLGDALRKLAGHDDMTLEISA